MSSVLIVGAGISGLSTGYNLDILSGGAVDLRILEARSGIGGRTRNVREEASFIDFDLDMGGQDLFLDDFTAYQLLLSDGEDFPYTSVSWAPDDVDYLNCQPRGGGVNCQDQSLFRSDLGDSSFRGTSLATFFADNFFEPVRDDVRLNAVVTEIDYSRQDKVVARTRDGRTFEADQLVVAVPVTQLQNRAIRFNPPLPSAYTRQIDRTRIFQGSRIWVEFSEKFYEDVTRVDDLVYWDAARGKNTGKNVVTIQGVNEPELTNLDDVELLDRVLDDLDAAYDGKATATYRNFFVKNWSEEEFIEMTNVNTGSPDEDLDLFRSPVGGRIWFAGDYTRFGSENSAAQSGKYVAGRVYQELTGDQGLCAPFLRPDLIAGDEVCFSTPDQCEATADLARNGRESCSSWCDRQGLRCTGAWDDGTFCEKTGTISCGRTGNNNSICKCEPRPGQPAPTPKPTPRPNIFNPPAPTPPARTLCQGFLSPVDLISGNGVCVDTQDVCEAEADLNRNGRESCNAWCAREGLVCTGAWDDGAVCEKRDRIRCSTTGNRASICKCEPRDTNLCNRFLSPTDRIIGDEICTNTRSRCTATADLSLNNRESCDQWCARGGLRCTQAWNDGGFCEKRSTIPCSRTGNNASICQCEP